ncbi:hypothetical protein C8J57DRAFT_1510875 [Mycena rebaudengoi]|nr:hypothetical protein C8J57DRAFT_1510875 [Mycena rebaudengoi]
MSLLQQISQNAQRRVQQSSHSFHEDEENRPLGPDTPVRPRAPLMPLNGYGSVLLCPQIAQLDSVLGHRPRSPELDDEIKEFSRHTKVALREFVTNIAGQHGIPEEEVEDFVEASTLPTHKLLIVTLVAIMVGQMKSVNDGLKMYLLSSGFKASPLAQHSLVLLDPKLRSYKDGFMNRLLRHIRVNPGVYHIPSDIRGALTGRDFGTAVSNEVTHTRSEMKRKLHDGWVKKVDITTLCKNLAWNNTQEMTDEIWGRLAWLQLFLDEYRTAGKNERLFWDAVDVFLADKRAEALTFPEESRLAMSSILFEECLKEHIKKFPLKAGGKLWAGKQIPAWQKAISCTVEEMDGYTIEDVAGEDSEEGEGSGDNGGIDPDLDAAPAGSQTTG